MEKINGRTPEEIKVALELCNMISNRKNICASCPYNGECTPEGKPDQPGWDALLYIQRLESELDAALAKVPKWIGVEDRLPEESGYYLYLCNSPIRGLQNGVGVSYFQHKAKLWKKAYNPCVTHWMPLPESKKEDA